MIFGPLCDGSTAAPRVTMSLTASLSLRLILVRTWGRSTTRELNLITCIDISALRCSGRVGGAGYGRSLYGLVYGTSGLLRNALGKAYNIRCGLTQRGAIDCRLSSERHAPGYVGSKSSEVGCGLCLVRRTMPEPGVV